MTEKCDWCDGEGAGLRAKAQFIEELMAELGEVRQLHGEDLDRLEKAEAALSAVRIIPDVNARLGVGDGSVADAVTTIIGALVCAERERDEARRNLSVVTQDMGEALAEARTRLAESEAECAAMREAFDKAESDRNADLKAKLAKARELLAKAKCPACDGSGGIPVQVDEDEWEQEQCQWCYERSTLADIDGEKGGDNGAQ